MRNTRATPPQTQIPSTLQGSSMRYVQRTTRLRSIPRCSSAEALIFGGSSKVEGHLATAKFRQRVTDGTLLQSTIND